jgi:exo-1,4-beta-D-glucosaminidase
LDNITGLSNRTPEKVSFRRTSKITGRTHTITLVAENKSSGVALMIHPRLTRGKGGEDLVPVLWSDNYFSLLPGEKKTVTATFDASTLEGAAPELVEEGWNLEPAAP